MVTVADFVGGPGNDRIFSDGTGAVDGGGGIDTLNLDLSGGVAGVVVDLSAAFGGGTSYVNGHAFTNIEQYVQIIGTAYDDVITVGDSSQGYDGQITYDGNPGVQGGDGNDILTGGALGNYLFGGNGNDTLMGGGGSDYLDGGTGINHLDGGDGSDYAYIDLGGTVGDINLIIGGVTGVTYTETVGGVAASTFANIESGEIIGSTGNDTLGARFSGAGSFGFIGGSGDNTLVVDFSASAVTANTSGSTIVDVAGVYDQGTISYDGFQHLIYSAGSGGGTITGFSGSDTLASGAGNDIFDGAGGIDTASYANAASAVTVSLAISGAQDTIGAGTDTLAKIENLTGSAFDDTLIGDAGNNVLSGGAGDDILQGGLGNDVLGGGEGFDYVSYADATSAIRVSLAITGMQQTLWGYDTLSGVEGIIGSAFGDRLTGDGGDNTIFGGAGNDTIRGGDGNDVLVGGAGSDILDGGAGIDTASYEDAAAAVTVATGVAGLQHSGGGGNDTLLSIENLTGSVYGDHLTGDAGANAIDGGAGNDVIDGGGGNDMLSGGAGIDTLSFASGGVGVDVSLALAAVQNTGVGADIVSGFENLTGSAFADTLTGDNGANAISGGAGDDHIFGAGGDDLIHGGAGNDVLDGGTGYDTLSYDDATSAVVLSLAAGTATGGGGTDSFSGFEAAIGSKYADTLIGDAGANTLSGLNGADTLIGGGGADILTGGATGDRFVLTQASDSAVGADDIITDFNHAEKDKIDVSQVYAGKFSFLGTNAFDGHAGELHYATSGSDLLVSGDVNGDGQADFEIKLIGVHDVDVTDFFL